MMTARLYLDCFHKRKACRNGAIFLPHKHKVLSLVAVWTLPRNVWWSNICDVLQSVSSRPSLIPKLASASIAPGKLVQCHTKRASFLVELHTAVPSSRRNYALSLGRHHRNETWPGYEPARGSCPCIREKEQPGTF